MGMYIRKGIKFGPLRLNLSKSGAGMSVGVKGARFGIRSDGKPYVHAGRYGLYYRHIFNSQTNGPNVAGLAKEIEVFVEKHKPALIKAFTVSMNEKIAQEKRNKAAYDLGKLFDKLDLHLIAYGFSVYEDQNVSRLSRMLRMDHVMKIALPECYESWNDEKSELLGRAIDAAVRIINKYSDDAAATYDQDDDHRIRLVEDFLDNKILPVLEKKHLLLKDDPVFSFRLVGAITDMMFLKTLDSIRKGKNLPENIQASSVTVDKDAVDNDQNIQELPFWFDFLDEDNNTFIAKCLDRLPPALRKDNSEAFCTFHNALTCEVKGLTVHVRRDKTKRVVTYFTVGNVFADSNAFAYVNLLVDQIKVGFWTNGDFWTNGEPYPNMQIMTREGDKSWSGHLILSMDTKDKAIEYAINSANMITKARAPSLGKKVVGSIQIIFGLFMLLLLLCYIGSCMFGTS